MLKKTLAYILIKKSFSYWIMFETNMFIEMVICVAVDCKYDARHGRT